jgi:hypothetical protein
LLKAESKGRHFHQHIRNHFTHTKVDPRAAIPLSIPPSIRTLRNLPGRWTLIENGFGRCALRKNMRH